jgi:hypothetical protein
LKAYYVLREFNSGLESGSRSSCSVFEFHLLILFGFHSLFGHLGFPFSIYLFVIYHFKLLDFKIFNLIIIVLVLLIEGDFLKG